MKRPEYKTVKWEKCAAMSSQCKEYDYNDIKSFQTKYLNGDMNEVTYRYTLSLYYKSIAQNYFLEGDFSAFKENIKISLEEFLTAINLLKEGKPTGEATISNINN